MWSRLTQSEIPEVCRPVAKIQTAVCVTLKRTKEKGLASSCETFHSQLNVPTAGSRRLRNRCSETFSSNPRQTFSSHHDPSGCRSHNPSFRHRPDRASSG